MDQQTFDRLARAAATGASRRTVLGGLLAGLAASLVGGRARVAAQGNVPIGGQCSAFGANAECSQAGTPTGGVPVICSDNGVARDGQFNCCRNAGGACSVDFHCCGAALCQNGFCGGAPGGGAPSGGSGLGSACTSTSQCSQSGGSVVCADNGNPSDGALNCCRNQGGACAADSQCCLGLFCVNGTCGGSATGTNLTLGAACSSTEQCSQAGGTVVCANNGYTTDGPLNCCRNQGGACFDTVYSADCCSGLYCVGGACTDTAAGTGGLALGAQCQATGQCSQAGGAVVCADNGLTTDGALNCCRNAGGACASDFGCCGGTTCIGGVCTGLQASGSLALGAACSDIGQCNQDSGYTACDDNGIASDGALNCCHYEGGVCFGTGGCCGGLDCIGGLCVVPGSTTPANPGTSGGGGGAGSLGLGAACTSDDQCSQEGGDVVCQDNGIVTDGERNCCRYQGACFGDSGCCAGQVCCNGSCQAA